MVKTKLLIDNLLFFLLNKLIKKLRKTFKYQEIESKNILMFNPKNTLFIKKLTLTNPMSENKNCNLFSKEFNKKEMSFLNKLKFPELLFINNPFYNLLLTERELDLTSEMVKKNISKTLLKFSPLNSLKTLEFKKNSYLDPTSTNNTPLNLN